MPTPTADLDSYLRVAAFDALRRVTEPGGGVISRERMTAGFAFEGGQIPFALRARGIWKPGILGPDGAALSLTTASIRKGTKPRYDDQVASDEGWFQYRYQGTDPKASDNRAVRRAFEMKLPLIYFYGVGPGRYEAVWPVYVVGDEPSRLTFRLAADAAGSGNAKLFSGGAEAPLKRYATALVKRRLHQHRFRELVVNAYGERCTVCQLHHTELLDAAHILEDKDERGKPEVPNGLALCKIHHGAFDANILGIAPDLKVHIRGDLLAEVDGPMLKHGFQQMDGRLIPVPGRTDLRPNPEYLGARFETFQAA
jgi:putative restriction endonuclease